ncbi:MAG: hypothetical protein ACR2P0_17005 [Acidimicrobiales bacterium]
MTNERTPRSPDRGAGLLSMVAGVFMFIALLTMTLQITWNLYTTSVVTGLALDAARDVAESDGISTAEAEADFASRVGGNVDFDIQVVGDTVEASVRWETNSIFPSFSDARVFGVLDRTFEVRVEEQRT